MNTIKHDNIIYIHTINPIGGVETYCYELIKKYHNLDIAVVCKRIHPAQKKRMREFCKVYVHRGQPIECKILITNWDTSIIEYVNPEAKVYTGVHADYTHPSQRLALPIDNPRITYICITEDSKKKYEDYAKVKGRTILCRNPLTIDTDDKPLVLMSASRLTYEKGGHRCLELANELDRQGIDYIWLFFTSDEYDDDPVWQNKKIIKMKNRFDLGYFYKLADWYIQPSEVEGDSYSLKEALYRGTPIIACELPYFKEYGIEDNVNALFIDLDCKNIKSVAERMTKKLKFEFKPIEDGYDKILAKGKSHYKEDLKKKIKIKTDMLFYDVEENINRFPGEIWEAEEDRLIDLVEKGILVSEVEQE